jgi:hypothetical protein
LVRDQERRKKRRKEEGGRRKSTPPRARRPIPGALVLAVAALHLLVRPMHDLLLQDLGALPLFNPGHLEDLRGVEVGVGLAAHHVDVVGGHFVHRDARVHGPIDLGHVLQGDGGGGAQVGGLPEGAGGAQVT